MSGGEASDGDGAAAAGGSECSEIPAWLESVESICSRKTPFGRKVDKAILMIERSFALYGAQHFAISFNGGKDSTVVFHLIRAAIARRCIKSNGDVAAEASDLAKQVADELRRMPILYFEKKGEFPAVLEFIRQTSSEYGFEYRVFDCGYIEGLQKVVDNDKVTGIAMGVRKGDPWTDDLQFFSPSSDGWPPFMRVNPILDWEHAEVWDFLRTCNFPLATGRHQDTGGERV